jgi:hypothetical protein
MPSPNTTPPAFISHCTSSTAPAASRPSESSVPVAALGHGSRTKKPRASSSGRGRRRPEWRSRWMLAAQPVAPVPVATIRPEEDWRSARSPTRSE